MPIGPITDAYIDSIINANDPYNPNLNKTQGVQLRTLVKLLRDRFEQQAAGLVSKTYADLSALVNASELAPGQLYLLTDYATVFHQPVTDEIVTGTTEPLVIRAATANTFGTAAVSAVNPADIISYDFSNNGVVVIPAVAGNYNFAVNVIDNVGTGADEAGIYVLDVNNAPIMYTSITSATGTGPQQSSISIPSAPYSIALAGTYTGSGFKIKINGTVTTVTAYDHTSFDQTGDYSAMPRIASAISANGSIQAYNSGSTAPGDLTLPDDSAGTPAVTQPRNGWITYREDAKGNAAWFDWRNVVFRRFAADLTGIPEWATGGSYGPYSFLTSDGNLFGVNATVLNDPNESLDTSPSSPYILLFSQDSCVLPNLANQVGPFGQISADTSTFLDLPPINGTGNKQRLGTGTYPDNLPNVVLANGSTELSIGDGTSDLHFDHCSFCVFPEGGSAGIFLTMSNLEIRGQTTGVFGNNSTNVTISAQANNNLIARSQNISLAAASSYNLLYNCTLISVAEGSTGNVIQNCQNVVIGGGGNSNSINGNNIKFGLNCSGNVIGAGSTDITFHGANNSNTIGAGSTGIEFGVGAAGYIIGNNVVNCYFADAAGSVVPDGSTGLVPWQTPVTGFTPGNWNDLSSKSTNIENETSLIQYKIDGIGEAMIVYVGAQFTIKTAFSGNTITLGVVGTGACPVSLIKKYFTILDSVSGGPFGVFLAVDTAGNLSVSLVPGSSGNLPNGPDTVYFIDLFYKPTVPIFYYTKTAGFTTQGCSAPMVGTQIPYSKIYQSYISTADAQNNVAVADSATFNSDGQANANSLGSCISSPVVQNVTFSVSNSLVNYYHESTAAAFNGNIYTHLAVVIMVDGQGNVQASIPVPPGTSEWLQTDVNTGWNIGIAIQQTIQTVSPKSVSINSVSIVAGITDLGIITGTLNDGYRWLMTPRNIGTGTAIDITVSDDTDAAVPVLLKNEMGDVPFFPKLNAGLYSNFTHDIGGGSASHPSNPNNWFTEFRWVPDNWTALSINVGGENFSPVAGLYARRSSGDVLLDGYNTGRPDQLMEANDIFVLKKSTGDPASHRIKVTDDRTNNTDPIVVAFFGSGQAYVVMQPGDTAYGADNGDANIDVLIYTRDIALQTADRLNIVAVFGGTTHHYADNGQSFLFLSTDSNGGERVITIQD